MNDDRGELAQMNMRSDHLMSMFLIRKGDMVVILYVLVNDWLLPCLRVLELGWQVLSVEVHHLFLVELTRHASDNWIARIQVLRVG